VEDGGPDATRPRSADSWKSQRSSSTPSWEYHYGSGECTPSLNQGSRENLSIWSCPRVREPRHMYPPRRRKDASENSRAITHCVYELR
jgi:hypothetical protein